jgi:hypothetical protein
MRHVTSSVLGLAAIGLLAGCPDRTISGVVPEQGRVEYKDIPQTINRNIDILFVIDDSVSMADKQANLAANFPNFINVLNTIDGGLPDVHIGVVTSDMGTKMTRDSNANPVGSVGQGGCANDGDAGRLQVFNAPVNGTFISDIKQTDGTRVRNYTGDLSDVFSQMARGAGAQGCGFEQHLHAMKAALDNNPANTGFLRPDAYLAVIFIADEDDCSMAKKEILGPENAALGPQQSFRCTRFGVTCQQGGQTPDAMNVSGTKSMCGPNENSQYMESVQYFVDFLKGLKDDPSKVIVAGIMGTTEPFQVAAEPAPGGGAPIQTLQRSCSYQGANGLEVAYPPVRLKWFLEQFPARNTFTTICQQNLQDGLVLIAELLKSVIGNPCLEGKLADADPSTPEMEYDCSVSDVQNFGQENQIETIVPQCNAGITNKPCWRIDQDADKCATSPNNHIIIFERDEEPPPDTRSIVYCVTEAD